MAELRPRSFLTEHEANQERPDELEAWRNDLEAQVQSQTIRPSVETWETSNVLKPSRKKKPKTSPDNPQPR
jgi:hypothetical protein